MSSLVGFELDTVELEESWKNLKEQMAEQFQAVAEREGDPDLINKIADGDICTEVDELVTFLTEKEHPALTMPPIL